MSIQLLLASSIAVIFIMGFGSQSYAEVIDIEISADASVPGCEETNSCFIPYEVTINVGDTVRWTGVNFGVMIVSGTPEDGSDGIFQSGLLILDGVFSHTFLNSGTFPYFDDWHPWSQGVILVKEQPVGGEIIPIEHISLILAGAQSFSWMFPVILSGIGIVLFVVSRKSKNSYPNF